MLLIIGGHPRSGTSMVRDLLNRHPNIYVTRELSVRGVYPEMMGLLETADETHRASGKYARLHGRKERLVSDLWFGLSKYDEDRARFDGATVVGNKTPGSERFFAEYEERIGYLAPRYIYCLRDPVKVVSSNLNVRWSNGKFGTALARLRAGYEAFMAARDALGERLMVFRVEEFAERPVETCRALCAFLGVSGDAAEAMAETPPANTMARHDRKGKTGGDRVLSDEEIAAIRGDPVVARLWTAGVALDPGSSPG